MMTDSAILSQSNRDNLGSSPKIRGCSEGSPALQQPKYRPCFRNAFGEQKQTRIPPRSRCARSKGGLVPGRWAVHDAGGEGRNPHLVPYVGDLGSSAFAL